MLQQISSLRPCSMVQKKAILRKIIQPVVQSATNHITLTQPGALVTRSDLRSHSTVNKQATTARTNQLSIVDHASELWIALRWKAANTLTSSLSSQERDELFRRLNPGSATSDGGANISTNLSSETLTDGATTGKTSDELNLNDHDTILTKSIAEAVAAARAEEAQRLSSKWEKEKEEIIRQAELAAHERIQSEIQIQQHRMAFEKWKLELEKEKGSQNSEDMKHQEALLSSEDTNVINKGDGSSVQIAAVLIGESIHPVLGPVVLDLGYKRIHIASAKSLAAIPVWNKQRIYRHDRAKAMANDKLKTLGIGMPGIIGLHEDKNGKLSILDGQHRVGMMNILQEKLSKDNTNKGSGVAENTFDFDRILVEVYPQYPKFVDVTEDEHATEIFLEVNKAEPVKLIDMPGIIKKSEYKIINEAANLIYESNRAMFSASSKCRPPHLNIDNLRDAIFASNVLSRHNIKSAKQLEKWMLRKNQDLQMKYMSHESDPDDVLKKNNITKTAFEKASTHDFYLGLESSWLYE